MPAPPALLSRLSLPGRIDANANRGADKELKIGANVQRAMVGFSGASWAFGVRLQHRFEVRNHAR